MVKNKYKAFTPLVIKFISVASQFFSKAATTFAQVSNI
jgi:hypothetical protein